MIKKAYSQEVIQYIQDLEDQVTDLQNKNSLLENKKKLLEQTITDQQCKLNSIDYRFGTALQEWLSSKIGQEVKEHPSIDVDGYYEEYSGQRDHYHKVEVDWK